MPVRKRIISIIGYATKMILWQVQKYGVFFIFRDRVEMCCCLHIIKPVDGRGSGRGARVV